MRRVKHTLGVKLIKKEDEEEEKLVDSCISFKSNAFVENFYNNIVILRVLNLKLYIFLRLFSWQYNNRK